MDLDQNLYVHPDLGPNSLQMVSTGSKKYCLIKEKVKHKTRQCIRGHNSLSAEALKMIS